MHPRTFAQTFLLGLLLLLAAGPSLALPLTRTSSYESGWQTITRAFSLDSLMFAAGDQDTWTADEYGLSHVLGNGDQPLLSRDFTKKRRNRSARARRPVASAQSLAALRSSLAETIVDPATVQGPTNKAKGPTPSVLFLAGLFLIVVARFSRKPRWPLARKATSTHPYTPAIPALRKQAHER